MTGTPYLERLARRSGATGTVLCLGIDPDPAALPDGFPPDLDGIERFARLLVEVAAPLAAAVKPNLAFFEAYGSAGLAALERIRAVVPAGVPVIADAKRGDIGSTAARQAVALFDALGADAVTVSPYLGSEAVQPLLERLDRYAYVLCRTSNPGAGELQDLEVAADCRGRRPSRSGPESRGARGAGVRAGRSAWSSAPRRRRSLPPSGPSPPASASSSRAWGPRAGTSRRFSRHGPATAAPAGKGSGRGLLVNVSRGIAGAAREEPRKGPGEGRSDLEGRLFEAAADWARRLPVLP